MKAKALIVTLMIAVMTVMASAVSAQQGPGNPDGPGDRPDRPNRPGERGDRENRRDGGIVEIVVEQTGLTPQELFEQLGEDGTLSDVIEANGGDVQAVIDAALTDAQTRIEEAVANGDITQEEADERLAALEERVTEAVNMTPEARQDGRQGQRQDRREGRDNPLNGVVRDTLESAGITADDLEAAREAGLGLVELLEQNGVDVNAFVADVLAEVQSSLNEAVANGTITQEQADEAYARFEQRLNDKINGETPDDTAAGV